MTDIIDLLKGTITDTPQSWNSVLFARLESISKSAIAKLKMKCSPFIRQCGIKVETVIDKIYLFINIIVKRRTNK